MIDVYPFGNFLIPIYCFVVTYAIMKYRLLDITLIVTNTGIFIVIYSLVLGIPFAIVFGWQQQLIAVIGQSWWLVPLITSTVLATVGPFIYIYFQRRAEDRLLAEQRRYQATLRQASRGMGRIKDLRRLVTLIVHIMTRTVHVEFSMVFVRDARSKKFKLAAYRSNQFRSRNQGDIEPDSAIVKNLLSGKEPVVYEEIKQRTQDYGDLNLARLEAELKILDAAVLIPSLIDNELLAILVLGPKISGQLYSDDDLAVFTILANQVALAIENAQFYDDIKKTHEQLLKTEKMATIGVMADGLSHQINNRLHAMGFITGDALDTIRRKQDIPMSPELKELLTGVEHALTRIENNVRQGGEVVSGLLKYSRKSEEGKTDVDLDKLVKATLDMTQFKIKPGEMTVVCNYNGALPKIYGSFTQLQEVFFNLIDNAYDAMMQRKQELREPGYAPTIKISAVDGHAAGMRIEVEDNGIGIKEDDRDKLFTPFFTTKLSSRKGTGLGLYVIQRLIEENHKGEVRYESKYGEGTRFFITLPTVVQKS
jgi:signal transduction histidine kinase